MTPRAEWMTRNPLLDRLYSSAAVRLDRFEDHAAYIHLAKRHDGTFAMCAMLPQDRVKAIDELIDWAVSQREQWKAAP